MAKNKVDLNQGSRDPDARRGDDMVYQVVKITSDGSGEIVDEEEVGNYYYSKEEANKIADQLNKKLKAGGMEENLKLKATKKLKAGGMEENLKKLKSIIRECIMEILKEHHIESETKKVDGTVNFNGDDYDYSAEVNYNVEVGTERHGEDYAIVDEDSIEVEVLSIDPEPLDAADEEAISDMIEDDVRSKV